MCGRSKTLFCLLDLYLRPFRFFLFVLFSIWGSYKILLSVFQSDIQTVQLHDGNMKGSPWRFIDWLALEHKIKYGRRSALAGVKSTLRVRESNLDTKYVYSFYPHCATYLIDWTDERQSWVVEGHWCSVLGDWLPLDLNSFIFSRLLSFLLFRLSFALPQLFCLYQTPTGIWPLLTRSAKIFETGWWKINCKYIVIIYIFIHHVQSVVNQYHTYAKLEVFECWWGAWTKVLLKAVSWLFLRSNDWEGFLPLSVVKVVESVLKRTPVLLVVVFLLFVDFNNWNSFRVSLLYFGVLFWGTLPLVVVWSWLEEKEDVGPLQGAPDPLMYQPPSWVNRHVSEFIF